MLQKINNCVSCDLPCIGTVCPNHERFAQLCDVCGIDEAEYYADGEYYCEPCLEEQIKYLFHEMSFEERVSTVFTEFRRVDASEVGYDGE